MLAVSRPVPYVMKSDVVELCIGQATLAPSIHNTQPWLFRVSEEHIELIADRTRGLAVMDPFDRELTISCGAALFNLRVAAALAGHDAFVELLPVRDDPDVLARVIFATGTGRTFREAHELGAALTRRRTYRKRFVPQTIDRAQIDVLRAAAEIEGAHLQALDTEALRHGAGELVAAGDAILWEDPRWRRELAAWMYPRRRGDGLSVPGFAVPAAQLLIRSFDMGEGLAARDADVVHGSPLLVVLGTDGDEPADWLRAGQALERLLLRACADGLQASYLNQPIQVPKLRQRVQSLVAAVGKPQLLLRLGYPASDVPPSPRRALADVMQPVWPIP
ncbi:MAG: Acg family FMN-binding oxidoreductase [Steroidobacteraceae bacterium]